MLSQKCIVEVDAILAKKEELPINTVWTKLLDVFKRHNISYYAEIHSSQMLCHPRNRGGLGLNPYNLHGNGKKIATVKWAPAGPGALRQVPPTKILRKAYGNPTNGEGGSAWSLLGLEMKGSVSMNLHAIQTILCNGPFTQCKL